MLINEEGRIVMTTMKTKFYEKGAKMMKPSPTSLFEAIKCLVETTHMIRITKISITGRLIHIDFFIKIAKEEGILDVKLSK